MTNIIATIVVFLSTNWTQIGTFHPTSGGQQTVEQATIATNTAVRFQWEGKPFEFILSSVPGPVVGERKGPLVPMNSQYWLGTNWSSPGCVSWVTNLVNTFHVESNGVFTFK